MTLNPAERALLDMADDDTCWLPEFRNGVNYGAFSTTDRAVLTSAVASLVERGLLRAGLSSWAKQEDASAAPLTHDQLMDRFADGSAWEPEGDDVVAVDITAAGERALADAVALDREGRLNG